MNADSLEHRGADMDTQSPSPPPTNDGHNDDKPKNPVQRGARACMVCRSAKMRCIGGDDQASDMRPCNRCKKAGVECRFEKHRRGRKPGSKLSEASKMLRRIEKDLQTHARPKVEDVATPRSFNPRMNDDSARPKDEYMDLEPTFHPIPQSTYPNSGPSASAPGPSSDSDRTFERYQRASIMDGQISRPTPPDDDGSLTNTSDVFPSNIISKEKDRQSLFLRTVLGPSGAPSRSNAANGSGSGNQQIDLRPRYRDSDTIPSSTPTMSIEDPISAGIVSEAVAEELFDQVFVRLNPFINLFDPVLHTVSYVRRTSPFLFTVLLMAGAKFFRAELFKACQKMANEMAGRAFMEQWKGVGVVQAFACLTYWQEPNDNRTFVYIGYACRLAVEAGLNRYFARPPTNETDHEYRERRNRERTYLVLFVHDRSLSMQTGKSWMLPEDELVRNSATWHISKFPRPEDVIVAAFVQLRRLSAETSDVFYLQKDPNLGGGKTPAGGVDYEVLLRGCNARLDHWISSWTVEMERAGGNDFHHSLLAFFRLHVRLFLNNMGLESSMTPHGGGVPNLHALSVCYMSATETLEIVTAKLKTLKTLRYVQDSISVMTAYAALFLLRLVRRTTSLKASSSIINTQKVHDLILQTANAYNDVALKGFTSSAEYHAKFLKNLVAQDAEKDSQQPHRLPSESSDTVGPYSPVRTGSTSVTSPTTATRPSLHGSAASAAGMFNSPPYQQHRSPTTNGPQMPERIQIPSGPPQGRPSIHSAHSSHAPSHGPMDSASMYHHPMSAGPPPPQSAPPTMQGNQGMQIPPQAMAPHPHPSISQQSYQAPYGQPPQQTVGYSNHVDPYGNTGNGVQPQPQQTMDQAYPGPPQAQYIDAQSSIPQHNDPVEEVYYRNMFQELGFVGSESGDLARTSYRAPVMSSGLPTVYPTNLGI
ncbi:hypothetical protein FRC02_007932 [Tulasnella sp. 418]|nr:hypothetical protein FRC02_007932 [Tulasnella sp. 418]